MTQLTDEMLVAYVDGELSAEDAADVERALQADHKVREAVQVFRDSAEWSRRAFDDVLREPVPERLIRAANGQVEETPQVAVSSTPSRFGLAGLAMAASIALAIGVGSGYSLSGLLGSEDAAIGGLPPIGTVDRGGALHTALESTTSGTLTQIADTGDVMPLTTFVERDGRYCREFQAVFADPSGSKAAFGIACRVPTGSWQVQAVLAAPDPAQAQAGNFIAASGETEDPLQLLTGSMSDAGPISLDAETAILASGWK